MNRATNNDQLLFWGCFIALITTAFGFISRIFLITTWGEEFGLDPAEEGRLLGIGIWPFAFSIIGISLIIDRIGYKTAMWIAFLGHIIWAIMGVSAYFISQNGDVDTAFQLLYWGSLALAIGNGGVEQGSIIPDVRVLQSDADHVCANVDLAKLCQGPLHHIVDLLLVRNVGLEAKGAALG